MDALKRWSELSKLSFLLSLCVVYVAHPNSFGIIVGGLAGTVSIQDVAVDVIVGVNESIARVSELFVCATLDWWPGDKCDNGTCSWEHASLLDLDLTNPLLQTAVKGLSPLLLRLGGTLQDKVIYDVGNIPSLCQGFTRAPGLFGFSDGCLNMSRWKTLNEFFLETGSQVAFGLNALYGREANRSLPWNSSNARSFIQHTFDSGYQIYAWEFGNELSSHGIGANISAPDYASSAKELRAIVDEIYAGQPEKPYVVAPDGFFQENWYKDLLQDTGSQVLNACTYHIYNLGPGNASTSELDSRILDPSYLDREAAVYLSVRQTLQAYGPWAQAWVGEAGGSFNSGQLHVSHSFINSFWYVDQLGMAATYNNQVYCRQSLIGGNYGLLNTTTFHPNPDYYSALLWQELMGRDVLRVVSMGSSDLRIYAHCSKGDTHSITVALINLSNNTQFNVHFPVFNSSIPPNSGDAQSPGLKLSIFGDLFSSRPMRKATQVQNKRLEYHLTPSDGDLHSQKVELNGYVLDITPDGSLPSLRPFITDRSLPLIVAPTSIVFVKIPDISVPACLLSA